MIQNNTDANSGDKKRLGILQTGRAPGELINSFPDYDQMFVDLLGSDEFDYRHWPVLDGIFPDSIDEADAWLITGSKHGAYEEHAWIPVLEALIREISDAGKPMVGICFGHQIIAQAMGGKVEKFTGGWSVGRVEYSLDDRIFGNGNGTDNDDESGQTNNTTALLAFHQDQVVEAPPTARTVGSTDFCEHAALVYGDNILTLQPHPEFTQTYIKSLLQARGKILPDDIKNRATEQLDQTIVRDSIAVTLRRFLQQQTL